MTQKNEALGRIIKEIVDRNGSEIFSETGAKRFYSILTDESANQFDLSPIKVMCESDLIQTLAGFRNLTTQERRNRLMEIEDRLIDVYKLDKNICDDCFDAFCYALGVQNNGNTNPNGEELPKQTKNGNKAKISESKSESTPQDVCVDDFILGSLKNGFYIQKYKGISSSVIIPDIIRGRQVVGIGESAFEGNSTLEEVCISSATQMIGENAFRNCKRLKKIYCKDIKGRKTVKTPLCGISKNAFDGNAALEEVWIPPNVTIIGENAFRNCTNLREIHAHRNIKKILKCAFQGCISIQHMDFGCGVPAEKKIVIFSPKTTVIGPNAFCTSTWKADEKEYVVKEVTVHGIGNFKRAFNRGIPIFKHSFLTSLLYSPVKIIIVYLIIVIIWLASL